MPWQCLWCAGWLVLASGISVSAATYEVAQRNPQASDDGDGTRERPWKTITRAAEKAGLGDTVVVRDGIYREQVTAKTSGTAQALIQFKAAPGAHVVLTGADRLTGWQKAEGGLPIYRVPWTHRFIGWSKHMTHPDNDYHRLIGRCEQVAIDGYLLRQVLEANQLAPGTFFVNLSNQVLQVWDLGSRDLNQVLVEASVRQEVFQVDGDYVQLRGLRFRFAANMAQHGAVVLAGRHDTLEDCTIEGMNASGATFSGEHQVVRRCVFRGNRQLGFGPMAPTTCCSPNPWSRITIPKALTGVGRLAATSWCCAATPSWSKAAFCAIVATASGLILATRTVSCASASSRTTRIVGFFTKISLGLQAHDNVIIGNGFATTAGAWGAQAGISISSSPECRIERNLILGNREGFNFREQTRTTMRIGQKGEAPIWNHDETIRRNIIAVNRDAQVWGWFDMKDGHHWPAKAREGQADQVRDTPKPGDIAGAYRAKDRAGHPQGLALEKLRLSFVENVYFAEPGQGWFEWGVSWGRHKSYSKLSDFQAELGFDLGSRVFDPGFAKLSALDCRLSAEAMAALR